MWNDAVVTNAGKELLAQWLGGGELKIESAASGSGTVAAVLLMGQSDLVNKKQTMSIIRSEKIDGGMRLQLQLTSAGVSQSYTINQIGIWASLAGGGKQLIAIFQDGAGISVPSFTEMPDYVFTFYATIQMSNEGQMTVNVDSSAIVTRADFELEKTARQMDENALKNDYTGKVNAEAAAREATDDVLSGKIDAETSARQTADSNLQKDYDGKIDKETEARKTADSSLSRDIATEATARSNGDTDLDSHQNNKGNPHGVTQKQLIDAVSTATELADGDLIPFADVSAGTTAKITKANFKKSLGLNSIIGATITLGASQTYSGGLKTQTVSSVVLSGKTLAAGTDYVVSGNTATNAGEYTLIVTGINNYTGSIAKTWEIVKASGSASPSTSSVSIAGVVGTTKTVSISRSGDGSIITSVDTPDVAEISLNGTNITIKAISAGTAHVSVTVTAGTNHKAASTSINVTIKILSTVLNDNAWEEIRYAADNNLAASLWSVGATKLVHLEGTVGTLELNESLWVYILGFNHNASVEGNNLIHFGGFKTEQTNGIDVGLVDGGYNSGYNDGTMYFNMNHSVNTNAGGWKSCNLRYDILGSTDVNDRDATDSTATNPVVNTLMAALPGELRAVLKPMIKLTDNVGKASGNVAGNVTATRDYLPLLAEYEFFGARSYANTCEQNYQKQYAYYANGNSRVKYRHDDTGTAAVVWSRSPSSNSNTTFCAVGSSGSNHGNYASWSRVLSPAFAV